MDDRLNHEQKMFSKTNWEFTKKIVEGNFESQVSPILTLDVSKKCNFRCNHCVDQETVNKDNLEIDWEILKQLLVDLKMQGCSCVELTGGGEPTTYTHFKDLIKLLSLLQYRIALISNGSNLHKYCDDIINAPFDWIRISLDSSNAHTHSVVHGCGLNVFKSITDSVKKIAKYKTVGISFLILPNNYKEIYNCAKYVKELNVKYIEVKPELNFKDKEITQIDDKIKEEIKKQINKIKNELCDDTFSIIYPSSINYSQMNQEKKYTICEACYYRTVLTPSGIYPCSYFRGLTDGTEIPTSWENMVKIRNSEINKINPSKQCKHFCARNKINECINILCRIKKCAPEFIDYLGWPIDYGNDIEWM
ncbi:radical SAM protein [Holdemanella porci]|uniref:radical SAM protein n=2 Tax=Holdemanella porci TaxID=2652276 RepID=UPI00389081E8